MSAPSLRNITQTSQREFAGAKVQQIFGICKKNRPWGDFLLLRQCRLIIVSRKRDCCDQRSRYAGHTQFLLYFEGTDTAKAVPPRRYSRVLQTICKHSDIFAKPKGFPVV